MTTERDTHFQGWASLLYTEIAEDFGHLEFAAGESDNENGMTVAQWELQIKRTIAQRAYDLKEHIMLYAPAAPVPDMTEWPAE